MSAIELADSVVYDAISLGIVVFGVIAWLFMWRNAMKWRGRKQGLRILSGLTCLYLAIVYAWLFSSDVHPDVTVTTLLVRPGVLAMVVLAASFSYLDA